MNILTIDVGNTNIAICLFNKEKPIRFVKIRNTDITNKLRGCKSGESAFAIISQYLKNKAA